MSRESRENPTTIGIDASRAFLLERTGIEEYSYQLIKHLRNELASERVILYTRRQRTNNKQQATDDRLRGESRVDFSLPKRWEVRELWGPRLWTQGSLALEMLRRPIDVLLVPAHTAPWIHPTRTITVVHGLEYERCPESYSPWERRFMRFSIRNSCRWSSRIIAVSENTKRDLMLLYGLESEKITVVYEGVNRIALSSPGAAEKWMPVLAEPYFFFVGRIEARKNIGRIIEAFGLFKDRYRTHHKLVLAGNPGYGYEYIKRCKVLSNHADDIVELGYVSDEEKFELMKRSDGFLFPTLYEGFGLPLLEAQSLRVPVLTSTISSLPEISGPGAAFLVDPLDVRDISRGMERLVSDEATRRIVIDRGLENAKRFSWERCAADVALVLRSS